MIKTSLESAALSRIREKYRTGPLSMENKAEWLAMWVDYSGQGGPPDNHTLEQSWQNLLQQNGMGGLFLYDRQNGDFIGFAHYILHGSTWHKGVSAYVEDGYIVPAHRPRGAMLVLYEDLIDKAKAEGWDALYWMTREDNTRARRFYDRIAQKTNWVRYEYDLKGPS